MGLEEGFSQDLFLPIGLWLVASFIAGLISSLDVASSHKEPMAVLNTREWQGLFLINTIVAFILIYGAYLNSYTSLSYFGFFAVIFGYPLLLHSKLFTIRSDSQDNDKSVGPEYLLQLADKLLKPGITKSIDEQCAHLCQTWRGIDIRLIEPAVGDYLAANRPDEETINFINELISDAKNNSTRANENARQIFYEVEKIGGQRAVKWVMSHSKPRGG